MTATKSVRKARQHRSEGALERAREEDPLSGVTTAGWGWPWTWWKLRGYMASKYRFQYTDAELRTMELKWRKIFADVGWSVKGQ